MKVVKKVQKENRWAAFWRKQPPTRIIALSFFVLIMLGSALLSLPCSLREGVSLSYVDALFVSASASTTTGLSPIVPADTFTTFGRIVLAFCMQIGGLGITAFGAGLILVIRRRINLKERLIFSESMNLSSGRNVARFLGSVFTVTFATEATSALLCFAVLRNYYPTLQALGYSVFHAIAAYNNAGMDIFGSTSIFAFRHNVWFNLITVGTMGMGGLSFLVVRELFETKFHWRRFNLNTKVVLLMGLVMAVVGTLLIKLTQYDHVTWLGAFFQAESARMGGFTTYPLAEFRPAAIFVIIIWMFVGCAPGSTTGGIRTTTLFVLLQRLKEVATKREGNAFHYNVPMDAYIKAGDVLAVSLLTVLIGTFLVSSIEPDLALRDVLFENVSAYSTAGMSLGITSSLHTASKLIITIMMFVGRVSPMAILTMWLRGSSKRTHYPDGNIAIG